MKIGTTTINNCKIGSVQVNEVRIGGTLVWSGSPAYDADAQLFITNAGITNVTEQAAVNTLVVELKAANLWSTLYFMHVYLGSTATSQMYNLKNPLNSNAAFRLTFSGGWTHSSTGALPNGVNAWADTFFIPQSNLNITDLSSFGYYSRSNTAKAGEYVMGSNSGVTQGACSLIIRRDNNTRLVNGDFPSGTTYRAALDTGSTNGSGFFVGTIDASNAKLFRNGSVVVQNTTITLNQPLGDKAVVIGAIRSTLGGGSPVIAGYTNKECALDFASKKLTDSQVVTLTNLVQAFQTTLGRQV